ncbi:hypothetical protein DVH05_009154 [Phytophthora capsici]|nr:hypothetical protein DVH05_009154 [Phytophthora capsici]
MLAALKRFEDVATDGVAPTILARGLGLELESKHYETSASAEITPSAETAFPPTVKADKAEE